MNTTGICVQVICEDDCRKDIVEVSKEIADSCDAKELKIEEIDASLVNSKLKGNIYVPFASKSLRWSSSRLQVGTTAAPAERKWRVKVLFKSVVLLM